MRGQSPILAGVGPAREGVLCQGTDPVRGQSPVRAAVALVRGDALCERMREGMRQRPDPAWGLAPSLHRDRSPRHGQGRAPDSDPKPLPALRNPPHAATSRRRRFGHRRTVGRRRAPGRRRPSRGRKRRGRGKVRGSVPGHAPGSRLGHVPGSRQGHVPVSRQGHGQGSRQGHGQGSGQGSGQGNVPDNGQAQARTRRAARHAAPRQPEARAMRRRFCLRISPAGLHHYRPPPPTSCRRSSPMPASARAAPWKN